MTTVGQSVARIDAIDKVTGWTAYVSDLDVPNKEPHPRVQLILETRFGMSARATFNADSSKYLRAVPVLLLQLRLQRAETRPCPQGTNDLQVLAGNRCPGQKQRLPANRA